MTPAFAEATADKQMDADGRFQEGLKFHAKSPRRKELGNSEKCMLAPDDRSDGKGQQHSTLEQQ